MRHRSFHLTSWLAGVLLAGAGLGAVPPTDPYDHSLFDAVLAAYVDDAGRVDYAGLKASGALAPYLAQLAAADPDALGDEAQLAFWINVYNAYTLHLIALHHPVTSIKRITPTGVPLSIPFVHSPFRIRFVDVGGQTMSLDHVEHKIIRRRFDEPRIHFALVCAARSCPPLRREAYTGARLDAQLDDQGRTFLHDAAKNQVPADAETIRLSKIFKWFRGDFAADAAGLQAWLAPYFTGEVREKLEKGAYRVRYLDYDWALNEQ